MALAILVGGWALALAYGYPGIMTVDSFDQLREARAGSYTDAHPPAMAALWRLVEVVSRGPAGMFILQVTALLGGLYLILRRTFAPRRAAVISIALGLFPPILAPMAVVWKDALMAGLLALGVAGLLADRRWVRIAGLVALVAASAVRHNAPAATLPLIVILFELAPTLPTWRGRITRYAISTAAWLAVTVAALGINGALTDKPMHFWASSLALSDIVGTLAYVDGTLPDADLAPLLAPTELRVDHDLHATLRARHSPYDFAPLVLGADRLWTMPINGDVPAPAAKRAAIARAWRAIVFGHPLAWVKQRLATFAYVLALPRDRPGVLVMTAHHQNTDLAAPLGVRIHDWRGQYRWQRRMQKLALYTPLFRPWLYAAAALVLLLACRRHRDVFALLLGGLGAEASLALFAITPDYRYSHWLVLSTCLGIVLLVARRSRAARFLDSRTMAGGGDDRALGGVAREDPVHAAAPRHVAE